jgi:hypothetical protein
MYLNIEQGILKFEVGFDLRMEIVDLGFKKCSFDWTFVPTGIDLG